VQFFQITFHWEISEPQKYNFDFRFQNKMQARFLSGSSEKISRFPIFSNHIFTTFVAISKR
jgi:hypothetical protein